MSIHNVGQLGPGGIPISYSFIPGYGRLDGVTDATQMPNLIIEQVYFRADPDNTGTIYVGTNADVSATTGMPVQAGEFLPWHPVKALSEFWYVCENADDNLRFIVVR